MIKQDRGIPFSATASGTSIAVATVSGTTGAYYFVTDISGTSSGTAGTWTLVGGSTILWQGAGNVNYLFSEPLLVGKGNSVIFTMNGTTTTYANITGFYFSF